MLPATKNKSRSASRARNPQRTRERLLQAAFKEVYLSGFQGADLDSILHSAGVTKGALYHHFENKESLGYAIVDEVILGITLEKWVRPLQNALDPVTALIEIVVSTSVVPHDLRGGCPLNNLAQEMSPLDEGFRKRLASVFATWHKSIASALLAGQQRGLVRRDLDAEDTATFVIATYEGFISLSKNSQDSKMLQSGKRSIINYLQTLRAMSSGQAAGE
ncbi:MAG TPA: TetR family transcriptional regulator C-terminal domain-containing protein [Candidatus Acidoferrum sp.]